MAYVVQQIHCENIWNNDTCAGSVSCEERCRERWHRLFCEGTLVITEIKETERKSAYDMCGHMWRRRRRGIDLERTQQEIRQKEPRGAIEVGGAVPWSSWDNAHATGRCTCIRIILSLFLLLRCFCFLSLLRFVGNVRSLFVFCLFCFVFTCFFNIFSPLSFVFPSFKVVFGWCCMCCACRIQYDGTSLHFVLSP